MLRKEKVVVVKLDLVIFVDPNADDVCALVMGSIPLMHYQDHVVATGDMLTQLRNRGNLLQPSQPKISYSPTEKGREFLSISRKLV